MLIAISVFIDSSNTVHLLPNRELAFDLFVHRNLKTIVEVIRELGDYLKSFSPNVVLKEIVLLILIPMLFVRKMVP